LSTIALAALGGLAAAAATAAATGDASAVVNAVHAIPPGLHVALAHVPSASHAHQVLSQHLSLYAGSGGAGAATTSGAAAVVRHGLHIGLGK